MPTPTVAQDTPAILPIVTEYQRPVLTARGVAAAHLSDFQDAWDQLAADDRAWFAEWLRDLLVDACVPEARA